MSANERFEFITVTASAYDAATLATKLTAHSAQGWDVVTIVSAGSELTAFCRRPATGEAAVSGGIPTTVAVPAARVETPVATQAAAPAATVSTGASTNTASTPAGWYADPSHRYELRYWDGTAWTEHVARGGQQYTDPPVK